MNHSPRTSLSSRGAVRGIQAFFLFSSFIAKARFSWIPRTAPRDDSLRSKQFQKFSILLFSLIFIAILAITVFFVKKTGYHLIYSATKSMPRGFYLVIPSATIKHNDIVEFTPPQHIIDFVKNLHWLPQSNSLIKYVFAVSGDHVCVRDNAVWVNYKLIGKVYAEYESKKPLPQTKICSKLKNNEYLLLSTKQERSFDGRYFGMTTIDSIKGKAIPIFINNK